MPVSPAAPARPATTPNAAPAQSASEQPPGAAPAATWGRGVGVAIVIGLTLLMLGSLASLVTWQRTRDLAAWRYALAQIPSADVVGHIDQARRFGQTALNLWIEALASPREDVAAAARSQLQQQVRRWEEEDTLGRDYAAAHLAQALSESLPNLPAARRPWATALARQLLDLPWGKSSTDRQELLADLRQVIEADATAAPALAQQRPAAAPPPADSLAALAERPRDPRYAVVAGFDTPLAELPGGGLPLAMLSPADAAASAAPLAEQPLAADDPAPQALANPQHGPSLDAPAAPAVDELPSQAAAPAPSPADASAEPRQLWAPGEPALTAEFRRLHSAEPSERLSAWEHLRELGLSEVEIELGRLVTHPDRAVRKGVGPRLVGLAGIDARPWLVWLSRDADSEVRLTALGLMATSREPVMMDRVREMATSDGEPRIRSAANRSLQHGETRFR